MAQAISKPLSFSTTLRNPHRIADFLYCIKDFDGEVLTNSIIHQIIKNVLYHKIYATMPEQRDSRFNAIYQGDGDFSDNDLEEIISSSPQQHKEAGFDYGWPSRFDTWYDLLQEFGFISYSMGEKINITDSGKYMLSSVLSAPANHALWTYNEKTVESAMLNAMAKYQSDNPFSKNANSNKPLVLLLQTIEILKKNTPSFSGVSRGEVSILICWPNNSAQKAADYIVNMRKEDGFSFSDEQIYDKCLELLGVGHEKEKRFKISQITGEAVDEYIRKMRITGVISLRGNGRFIDENEFARPKIDYILKNYSSYQSFSEEDKPAYTKYMGSMDNNLIYVPEEIHPGLIQARQKALENFANLYSSEKLSEELDITCSKKGSSDSVLRLIDKPVRFEFLVSVLLCKRFGNTHVFPNYDADDEGLPTHQAGGGEPDIVCEDEKTLALIEVSLMMGRSDQINNEIIPIERHLTDYFNPQKKDPNAIFVAPKIHPDAAKAANFARLLDKVNLFVSNYVDFQSQVSLSESVTDLCNEYKGVGTQSSLF